MSDEVTLDIEWERQQRQLDFLDACGLLAVLRGHEPAIPKAQIILYGGAVGGGKILKDTDNILTPFGWKKGEDLKVKDLVNNPNGSVQRIIQIKPRVTLPLWRVSFSDGTSLDVAEDHLWCAWKGTKGRKIKNTKTFGEASGEIVETKELQEWIERGYNPQIPVCHEQPFNMTVNRYALKHKIDPYLLGLLLGDGTITKANIELTCGNEDRKYYSKRFNVDTNMISDKTLRFTGTTNKKLIDSLKFHGLYGTKSNNKYIPDYYKYSPIEDRYELIRGLMDTDGYNDTKDNGCYYTTISKQLAEDVTFILRSLGSVVTVTSKLGKYKTENGETVECSEAYTLYIKHRDKRKLFSLPRKKIGNVIEISKRVTSIEIDGEITGRCITVSSLNGLYITNDFIVTHNSDALLMAAFLASIAYPGLNIGFFRREYPMLEGAGGAIMRSHEMFTVPLDENGKIMLAKWNGTLRRWTFINNSVVQFCHCKSEEDVHNYMSQQFDMIIFDESTQFTEYQLTYLLTRNRATVEGIHPICLMATNPGGVSHAYHKKCFIEAGPYGEPVDVEVNDGVYRRHIFIPAKLEDNQVLEKRNPGYRRTLEGMPEDIRRALLDGDWNVFAGQYFKTYRRDLHVIEPFEIPSHWRRFGSLDWGFAAPACFLWHAMDPTMNRIYTYRELYVTQHRAVELAEKIKSMSVVSTGRFDHNGMAIVEPEELAYVVISPDAFRESGLGSKASPGETVSDEFMKAGINVQPADNRRVQGWQRMREYMAESPVDQKPYWQIFETCENLIRTLPDLIHDDRRVEDVSDKCEDHAPEAARYFLMSRPSPTDGSSFYAGSRREWSMTKKDEDEDDDEIGSEVTFYGL